MGRCLKLRSPGGLLTCSPSLILLLARPRVPVEFAPLAATLGMSSPISKRAAGAIRGLNTTWAAPDVDATL